MSSSYHVQSCIVLFIKFKRHCYTNFIKRRNETLSVQHTFPKLYMSKDLGPNWWTMLHYIDWFEMLCFLLSKIHWSLLKGFVMQVILLLFRFYLFRYFHIWKTFKNTSKCLPIKWRMHAILRFFHLFLSSQWISYIKYQGSILLL